MCLWWQYVPMKGKSKVFWLKLIGGPLQKRLANHQKSNLCLWRAICAHEGIKWRFLSKTDRMPRTKKAGRSPKKQLCVYEGQGVHMKGKSEGFWVKPIGCPLQKSLENHQKSNLCLWRAICAHEGIKWRFLSKTDRMPRTKKAGRSPKKQLCVYEGQYVPMKGKRKVFWLKLIGGPLQKRLENHQKSNLCLWRARCAHEGKK